MKFFFVREGKKSEVGQRYPAASVQAAEERGGIRLFCQCVSLMAAFFCVRHRLHAACCSVLRGISACERAFMPDLLLSSGYG
ncbi:hypothetical protein AB08_3748 [Escherichia coli 5-366-08_S1_C1]|nr:hypothetical protein AB08_3748 [Escherichia coli 5-366-08_S1_C1]